MVFSLERELEREGEREGRRERERKREAEREAGREKVEMRGFVLVCAFVISSLICTATLASHNFTVFDFKGYCHEKHFVVSVLLHTISQSFSLSLATYIRVQYHNDCHSMNSIH